MGSPSTASTPQYASVYSSHCKEGGMWKGEGRCAGGGSGGWMPTQWDRPPPPARHHTPACIPATGGWKGRHPPTHSPVHQPLAQRTTGVTAVGGSTA
eukprot:106445-Chlamydomonas_euryale.AAC.1